MASAHVNLKDYEVWFVTGTQGLYGPETLRQVAENSEAIAAALGKSAEVPVRVVCKAGLSTPEVIQATVLEANANSKCVGLICWMHTFSPAKMWISGLRQLARPLLHLHTQFGREIPFGSIDMDYMNLHQSAHGDREFGFIGARLRLDRKVVVGYWAEADVQRRIGLWCRAACGWRELQTLRVVRFGDNMREVAVTDGDKIEAQIVLGTSVNTVAVGDLAEAVAAVAPARVDELIAEYRRIYDGPRGGATGEAWEASVREAARIELGLRDVLTAGGYGAVVDCFQDLHGINQLPGIAVQRLMADGYGFGAEGDWRTAALVRAFKVMGAGLPGGSSFMEDYTYHMGPQGTVVLGAHMLEICPSIAEQTPRPRLEVHPLSIGGKADPARLVFRAAPASGAINAALVDMGGRLRLVVNVVDTMKSTPETDMPRLPVANAMWVPRPSFPAGAEGWILAGGAHHFAYTAALPLEAIEDLARMTGVETLVIDENTLMRDFRDKLRWNDLFYRLKSFGVSS